MPNDSSDRSTQQKTHGAQRRQALYNIAGQASHAINDIFNEQLRRLYGAQWEEEASSRAITQPHGRRPARRQSAVRPPSGGQGYTGTAAEKRFRIRSPAENDRLRMTRRRRP